MTSMEPSKLYEVTLDSEISCFDLSSLEKGRDAKDHCSLTISSASFSSSSSYAASTGGEAMELHVESAEKDTFNTRMPHWLEYFLEPRVSQGEHPLPLQSQSRPWLKFLIWIPISSIASMILVAYYWLPLLLEKGVFTATEILFWDALLENSLYKILFALPIVVGIVSDSVMDAFTLVMLLRGKRRRHLGLQKPRLTHAVIVCNYNEPIDVLRATVATLANNTLAAQTIVVLACEARDATAETTFETLATEFRGSFQSFFKTSHELAPGEIVGKSSNENFACRELYEYIQAEGLDPFRVMVTICDADSLFDSVFLEQLEAEYCHMPDGRRFLYNTPINTYRNMAECHPLVKAFEIRRCQFDLFSGLSFRPAQSNYSLTLGFAKEINFWDPTNTSEDFHTTLKAMAMTGKGTEVVVRIWSLILNDSVTTLSDRWTQAKRHMWGIEELTFAFSLFPVLRLTQWLGLLSRVCLQMFAVCTPSLIWLLFQPVRDVFVSLKTETQHLLVAIYVVRVLYDWIKSIVREVVLYRLLLNQKKLMMKRSAGEWLQLFLVWPLLASLSTFVFATLATWRVLLHAVHHDTLTYVTAPKSLNILPQAITRMTPTANEVDVFNTPMPKKSA